MLEALFLVCIILTLSVLSFILLAGIAWRKRAGDGIIHVVVLGDAGRSPRMQYHCSSLIKMDYSVELIGYGDSELIKDLRESKQLLFHRLQNIPHFINTLPGLARYILKVLFETLSLLYTVLVWTRKPSHVIVQTPPSVPTLFVITVTCLLRGSKMVVDYHNYGHTILALSLSKDHPLVSFAKWYERFFARFADLNICVSEAMKKDLKHNLRINAIILYDRPPSMFRPTILLKQHELFCRLGIEHAVFRTQEDVQNRENPHSSYTTFTEKSCDGVVTLRRDRPFLLISSTSWTEDEDFSILLLALEIYDQKASTDNTLPKILCVITGKGRLRRYYEGIIAEKNFNAVTIYTLWLSAEDYPLLLGSADLGVCLHKSSSGLDLPMKIVDMFGCGMPVCAIYFNCLHELLRHDHNGMVFHSSEELSCQLEILLKGFPAKNITLTKYRENLSSFQSLRWDHYWNLHILPQISV